MININLKLATIARFFGYEMAEVTTTSMRHHNQN